MQNDRFASAALLGLVDRANRIPAYLQIAQSIRDAVRGGRLPVGSVLPPERAVCERFGVSRMTLRQAYDLLEREGLLERRQGRGTFVSRERIQKQQQQMRSFTEEITAHGGKPSSRLISFVAVKQSQAAREFFGLPEDELLWDIRRVRLNDGVPIALEHAQIPCYLCPTLDRFNLLTQSLYLILQEHFKVRLVRCEEAISARRPGPQEKRHLGRPLSAAVLKIERRSYSANDTPVELGVTTYRGDLYTAIIRSVR
jgi:GntR family transcriptional regulator